MLNLLILLCIVYLLYRMAKVFRQTMTAVENPRFVLEKPPMPKDLAAAASRLEKWREEGRLSREDFERLMHLVREDAEKPAPGK